MSEEIKTISVNDKKYPKSLKEIKGTPKILYYRGELKNIDKIIEKTKLTAAAAASTLAILEIKGKVRNLGGNIYAISHS